MTAGLRAFCLVRRYPREESRTNIKERGAYDEKGNTGSFSYHGGGDGGRRLGGCSSSAQAGTTSTADTSSAASTTASSADSGNVIRVGVVCSMTGGSAIYGEGAQNAVDMAVEEINSGDSGYTVEIVNGGKVADDAKDAKQAMNAYNKVMADSPAAIVGSFFSSVTLPMATQAANDGMLLLATGATTWM